MDENSKRTGLTVEQQETETGLPLYWGIQKDYLHDRFVRRPRRGVTRWLASFRRPRFHMRREKVFAKGLLSSIWVASSKRQGLFKDYHFLEFGVKITVELFCERLLDMHATRDEEGDLKEQLIAKEIYVPQGRFLYRGFATKQEEHNATLLELKGVLVPWWVDNLSYAALNRYLVDADNAFTVAAFRVQLVEVEPVAKVWVTAKCYYPDAIEYFLRTCIKLARTWNIENASIPIGDLEAKVSRARGKATELERVVDEAPRTAEASDQYAAGYADGFEEGIQIGRLIERVEGWHRVEKYVSQEDYCEHIGISTSQLRRDMATLEQLAEQGRLLPITRRRKYQRKPKTDP